MKAVIMAGGKGTRLRPLTCNVPKPMVPILNLPMMEYILGLLAKHGFNEIYVTLHYLAEQIEQYFGAGTKRGLSIRYFTENTPLGTAGSVKNLESFLNDTFLVVSGDALTDIDLTEAFEFHRQKSSMATLLLKSVKNPLEYGVVITLKDGLIARFLEKPAWSEVFSDTVNTGIYILEPEIFSFCPPGQIFDFSKDLFPLLLQKKLPLYGLPMEGYWSDIGNIEQYRQAHYDFLSQKINLPIPGFQLRENLWVGENVEIAGSAKLGAFIHIGNNCTIGDHAAIEDFSALGNHGHIGDLVSIKRSIIGNYAFLGNGANLRGAILSDHAVLKNNVNVYEGAIVGEGCVLHANVTVKPNAKIWPYKVLESGTIVNDSLIWGEKLCRSLFGSRGITGLINREFTPEFCAKLGAALGSSCKKREIMVVSSDPSPAARMTKRALSAGLLSVGIDVYDLGTMPPPVTRFAVVLLKASGGVNIRSLEEKSENLLCEFFDSHGLNLDKAKERAIENLFWREDFPRAGQKSMGQVTFIPGILEKYLEMLFASLDFKAIRIRQFKIVTCYSTGMLSLLLSSFLERCGCQVLALQPGECGAKPDENQRILNGITRSVTNTKADLGILVDKSAEKISLVDEKGQILPDEMFLAVIALIIFKSARNGTISVPVTASEAIEKMAQIYQGKVIRTKNSPRSTMEKMIQANIKDPQFHPAFDALSALGRILEFMTKHHVSLASLAASVPCFYMQKGETYCHWSNKGRVMRTLIEQAEPQNPVELLDGIKIFHDGGWALVLPDSEEPLFKVLSEATSQEEADALAHMYIERINQIQLH
ncbi:MAG: sugar phosphate nucleotidyltransferase [Bacillota bacterium]